MMTTPRYRSETLTVLSCHTRRLMKACLQHNFPYSPLSRTWFNLNSRIWKPSLLMMTTPYYRSETLSVLSCYTRRLLKAYLQHNFPYSPLSRTWFNLIHVFETHHLTRTEKSFESPVHPHKHTPFHPTEVYAMPQLFQKVNDSPVQLNILFALLRVSDLRPPHPFRADNKI